MSETTYSVPGVSCQHCAQAIFAEVEQVPGVRDVAVELTAKTVTVRGQDVDDAAVRAAIDAAGYDVADGRALPLL